MPVTAPRPPPVPSRHLPGTRGLPGIQKLYGVKAKSFEPISDVGGPATVKALASGKVTAANLFTTTPAIAANDFVVLKDPKNNFPAQNVLPVMKKDAVAADAQKVLDEISSKLTTEDLQKLNERVSGKEKAEPSDAAADWLKEKGL